MASPIIARADALMQRRRQSDNEFDDIPVLTDSVDQIDDIPVLTEIAPEPELEDLPEPNETALETETDNSLPVSPQAPEAPSAIDSSGLREELIHELTSRIEGRIKAALPEIISSTIREFLAEQEMIENG